MNFLWASYKSRWEIHLGTRPECYLFISFILFCQILYSCSFANTPVLHHNPPKSLSSYVILWSRPNIYLHKFLNPSPRSNFSIVFFFKKKTSRSWIVLGIMNIRSQHHYHYYNTTPATLSWLLQYCYNTTATTILL